METTYNIMFVDDEPSILESIKRSLRKYLDLDISLSFFSDARCALEAIEQCPPDVLVTDMRMPHMSGSDLLQIVHNRFPSVHTFILSGYCRQNEALNLENSQERFLKKPFNSAELANILNLGERPKYQVGLASDRVLPTVTKFKAGSDRKLSLPIEVPDWEDDPLKPARGIFFGILFSIPFWISLTLMVRWLVS